MNDARLTRSLAGIGLLCLLFALLSGCSNNPPPHPWPIPTPTPTPTPTPPIQCGADEVLVDGVCKPKPQPPEPEPSTPPIGVPTWPEKLLRINEGGRGYHTNDNKPFLPFGVESCCDAWAKCPEDVAPAGEPYGTGWPSISACFIKETRAYGANLWHIRFAPWFATPEHGDVEVLWKPIGNLYNEDGSWNQAFIDKHREYVYGIGRAGGYVEIILDDWWLKNATGKDRQSGKMVPWPQSAVDAWGKQPEETARAAFFKMVESFGCFGNVLWATGNEEDLNGPTKEHLQWRVKTLREAEAAVGCNFVHMIGTGSFKGGIGADYQITHERTPISGPCGPDGLPCVNNEHNPAESPETEAARFKQALDAGQRWDAWRAGAKDADWEKRLTLFRQTIEGTSGGGTPPPVVGCFAPPGDDPLWEDPPAQPSVHPAKMRSAYEAAKSIVGDRCGTTGTCTPEREPCAPPIFIGCQDTSDMIAAELRKAGHCASGSWGGGPEIALLDPSTGWWEQYHPCATENGCYTGSPYKLAWHYRGTNPTPPGPQTPCHDPAPRVDHCTVKEHTKGPNWTVIDSTFKVHDAAYCASIGFTDGRVDCPIRMEGDAQRVQCESEVVGTPVYSGPGGPDPSGNPYLWRVRAGTTGVVSVSASRNPAITCSVTLTP